jgi:hypothetical protein
MRPFLIAATIALAFTGAAQAAPPADALPGTIHFDSASTTVKAQPTKRKKVARPAGRANMGANSLRDGTGKN